MTIDFSKPVDKSNRRYSFWYRLKAQSKNENWWLFFFFLLLLPLGF